MIVDYEAAFQLILTRIVGGTGISYGKSRDGFAEA